jgi:hypothetical protein
VSIRSLSAVALSIAICFGKELAKADPFVVRESSRKNKILIVSFGDFSSVGQVGVRESHLSPLTSHLSPLTLVAARAALCSFAADSEPHLLFVMGFARREIQ